MEFAYDYHQVYLYDADRQWSQDANEFLDALADAGARGLTVGIADDLVDLLMPRQHNFYCPLSVEHYASAPTVDATEWDHILEFPLTLPSGKLVIEGSGGCEKTQIETAPGDFRARWSGRNFAAAVAWNYPDDPDDKSNPPDEYRLQLWPDNQPVPPSEIKRSDDFE
jgi:hypothetical protein